MRMALESKWVHLLLGFGREADEDESEEFVALGGSFDLADGSVEDDVDMDGFGFCG